MLDETRDPAWGQLRAKTDEELVSLCLGGSRPAFEELVYRYSGRVFGIALRVVRNRDTAKDLSQETFLNVYRKLATFDLTRKFEPWIKRIAFNWALDYTRRHPPGRAVPLDDASRRGQSPPLEDPPEIDGATDPAAGQAEANQGEHDGREQGDEEEQNGQEGQEEQNLESANQEQNSEFVKERQEQSHQLRVRAHQWLEANTHATRGRRVCKAVRMWLDEHHGDWEGIAKSCKYSDGESARVSVQKAIKTICVKSPRARQEAHEWVAACREVGRWAGIRGDKVLFLALVDLDDITDDARSPL